jgi:hypothetical protein
MTELCEPYNVLVSLSSGSAEAIYVYKSGPPKES